MSGGGNKKKSTQSQGWEEAGSEFYQESYPLDAEIEVLRRDPKRLATLLPSKQTRAAIATIKIRSGDNYSRTAARKRTTTTRDATVRRRASAVAGDIQVAMMPDLSEMQSNEKTAWEEVMQLKALPVPMAQKKEMKAKILNEPNLRLQGYEQFRWRRRKMWDRLAARLADWLGRFVLWRGSMKRIEGDFGTGVVSLFLFVRWLFLLDVAASLAVLSLVALPTALLDDRDASFGCEPNGTASCCTEMYFNRSSSTGNVLLDVLQGTGFVERTVVFYGYYPSRVFEYRLGSLAAYYDAPLAYLLATLVCLVGSLVAVLRSAAGGFRERLVEGEGQFYRYCDLVLGGWDYCIDNERAAEAKRAALLGEIRAQLEAERAEEERRNRTGRERCSMWAARAAANLAVAAILAGAGVAIYSAFRWSTERSYEGDSDAERLLWEYLPSLTIVGLNVAVPFLFGYLIAFERYSPNVELRLTLIRTVFLRLASLIVLYVSLLGKVTCPTDVDDTAEPASTCVACAASPTCWETFVGQQALRLLVADLGSHLVLTFCVNLPRSLLARHVGGRLCRVLGEQSFDVPRHALDVVYVQTLAWFGQFYAPAAPLVAASALFVLFYVKKFACLVNCSPGGSTIYRASRSDSMYMLVLLVSYACAALPVAYSVAELRPSRSCGPFARALTVWTYVVELFEATPDWLRLVASFVGTAGFAVPCFVVLCFLLYYYAAVGSANRRMVGVLKNQLVLEGHDKQFLLDRLSLFIRQEGRKRGEAAAAAAAAGGGDAGIDS